MYCEEAYLSLLYRRISTVNYLCILEGIVSAHKDRLNLLRCRSNFTNSRALTSVWAHMFLPKGNQNTAQMRGKLLTRRDELRLPQSHGSDHQLHSDYCTADTSLYTLGVVRSNVSHVEDD